MNDKPAVYWVQDSGGVSSCHINDGRLNLKQALIGTLDYRNDGWHAILADGSDLTPSGLSLAQAKTRLESHYCQKSEVKPAKIDRMTPRVAQRSKI